MKNLQKTILLGLVGIFVAFGVTSCSFWERNDPIGPTRLVDMPGDSNQMANFYVSRGHGNQLGVFKRKGMLVVNVLPGDFLLEYTTKFGTFHIAFQAKDYSMLHIGLHNDDDVIEASIIEGSFGYFYDDDDDDDDDCDDDDDDDCDDDDDDDVLKDADKFSNGNLLLVAWPGNGKKWGHFFQKNVGAMPIVFIQSSVVVVSQYVIELPASLFVIKRAPTTILVNNTTGTDAPQCGWGITIPCKTLDYAATAAASYNALGINVVNTGTPYTLSTLVTDLSVVGNSGTPEIAVSSGGGFKFTSANMFELSNLTLTGSAKVVVDTNSVASAVSLLNNTITTDVTPAIDVISGKAFLSNNTVTLTSGKYLQVGTNAFVQVQDNAFAGSSGEAISCSGTSTTFSTAGGNTIDGTIGTNCGTYTSPF